jgi:threonine/homoserine/homoserine lactone efflux protein
MESVETTSIAVIFFTSYVVGLSGALQPGPLLMVNIAEVARRGFWTGPLLVVGHAATELAMVFLLAMGLGRFFQNGIVAGSVGVLGGSYLVWMGLSIVRRVRGLTLSLESTEAGNRAAAGAVLTGAWVSISNPGWLIWWATIGVTYILIALQQGATGLASFYTGHILSDFSWYSLVSFVVASGRRIISDSVYRRVLGLCGILLLAIGGYFVLLGIGFLRSLG